MDMIIHRFNEVSMSTLQISLPEHVKAVVDEQVASGRFPSEREYVCRLIEEDGHRRAQAGVESTLVSRLENPASLEMNAADWAGMREEFNRRVAHRVGQ
jgi:antitoxin ParD1/3/4